MTDPKPTTDAAQNGGEPFEQTLKRLEAVVQKLETPELPLEEALLAYEEGLRLVRTAHGKLDGMDARLEQLIGDNKAQPLQPPQKKDDGR